MYFVEYPKELPLNPWSMHGAMIAFIPVSGRKTVGQGTYGVIRAGTRYGVHFDLVVLQQGSHCVEQGCVTCCWVQEVL